MADLQDAIAAQNAQRIEKTNAFLARGRQFIQEEKHEQNAYQQRAMPADVSPQDETDHAGGEENSDDDDTGLAAIGGLGAKGTTPGIPPASASTTATTDNTFDNDPWGDVPKSRKDGDQVADLVASLKRYVNEQQVRGSDETRKKILEEISPHSELFKDLWSRCFYRVNQFQDRDDDGKVVGVPEFKRRQKYRHLKGKGVPSWMTNETRTRSNHEQFEKSLQEIQTVRECIEKNKSNLDTLLDQSDGFVSVNPTNETGQEFAYKGSLNKGNPAVHLRFKLESFRGVFKIKVKCQGGAVNMFADSKVKLPTKQTAKWASSKRGIAEELTIPATDLKGNGLYVGVFAANFKGNGKDAANISFFIHAGPGGMGGKDGDGEAKTQTISNLSLKSEIQDKLSLLAKDRSTYVTFIHSLEKIINRRLRLGSLKSSAHMDYIAKNKDALLPRKLLNERIEAVRQYREHEKQMLLKKKKMAQEEERQREEIDRLRRDEDLRMYLREQEEQRRQQLASERRAEEESLMEKELTGANEVDEDDNDDDDEGAKKGGRSDVETTARFAETTPTDMDGNFTEDGRQGEGTATDANSEVASEYGDRKVGIEGSVGQEQGAFKEPFDPDSDSDRDFFEGASSFSSSTDVHVNLGAAGKPAPASITDVNQGKKHAGTAKSANATSNVFRFGEKPLTMKQVKRWRGKYGLNPIVFSVDAESGLVHAHSRPVKPSPEEEKTRLLQQKEREKKENLAKVAATKKAAEEDEAHEGTSAEGKELHIFTLPFEIRIKSKFTDKSTFLTRNLGRVPNRTAEDGRGGAFADAIESAKRTALEVDSEKQKGAAIRAKLVKHMVEKATYFTNKALKNRPRGVLIHDSLESMTEKQKEEAMKVNEAMQSSSFALLRKDADHLKVSPWEGFRRDNPNQWMGQAFVNRALPGWMDKEGFGDVNGGPRPRQRTGKYIPTYRCTPRGGGDHSVGLAGGIDSKSTSRAGANIKKAQEEKRQKTLHKKILDLVAVQELKGALQQEVDEIKGTNEADFMLENDRKVLFAADEDAEAVAVPLGIFGSAGSTTDGTGMDLGRHAKEAGGRGGSDDDDSQKFGGRNEEESMGSIRKKIGGVIRRFAAPTVGGTGASFAADGTAEEVATAGGDDDVIFAADDETGDAVGATNTLSTSNRGDEDVEMGKEVAADGLFRDVDGGDVQGGQPAQQGLGEQEANREGGQGSFMPAAGGAGGDWSDKPLIARHEDHVFAAPAVLSHAVMYPDPDRDIRKGFGFDRPTLPPTEEEVVAQMRDKLHLDREKKAAIEKKRARPAPRIVLELLKQFVWTNILAQFPLPTLQSHIKQARFLLDKAKLVFLSLRDDDKKLAKLASRWKAVGGDKDDDGSEGEARGPKAPLPVPLVKLFPPPLQHNKLRVCIEAIIYDHREWVRTEIEKEAAKKKALADAEAPLRANEDDDEDSNGSSSSSCGSKSEPAHKSDGNKPASVPTRAISETEPGLHMGMSAIHEEGEEDGAGGQVFAHASVAGWNTQNLGLKKEIAKYAADAGPEARIEATKHALDVLANDMLRLLQLLDDLVLKRWRRRREAERGRSVATRSSSRKEGDVYEGPLNEEGETSDGSDEDFDRRYYDSLFASPTVRASDFKAAEKVDQNTCNLVGTTTGVAPLLSSSSSKKSVSGSVGKLLPSLPLLRVQDMLPVINHASLMLKPIQSGSADPAVLTRHQLHLVKVLYAGTAASASSSSVDKSPAFLEPKATQAQELTKLLANAGMVGNVNVGDKAVALLKEGALQLFKEDNRDHLTKEGKRRSERKEQLVARYHAKEKVHMQQRLERLERFLGEGGRLKPGLVLMKKRLGLDALETNEAKLDEEKPAAAGGSAIPAAGGKGPKPGKPTAAQLELKRVEEGERLNKEAQKLKEEEDKALLEKAAEERAQLEKRLDRQLQLTKKTKQYRKILTSINEERKETERSVISKISVPVKKGWSVAFKSEITPVQVINEHVEKHRNVLNGGRLFAATQVTMTEAQLPESAEEALIQARSAASTVLQACKNVKAVEHQRRLIQDEKESAKYAAHYFKGHT